MMILELVGEMRNARASVAIVQDETGEVHAVITAAHLIEAIGEGMEVFAG